MRGDGAGSISAPHLSGPQPAQRHVTILALARRAAPRWWVGECGHWQMYMSSSEHGGGGWEQTGGGGHGYSGGVRTAAVAASAAGKEAAAGRQVS